MQTCKIKCANLAYTKFVQGLSQSSVTSTQSVSSRKGRYIESSDEEEDYYSLPTFNLVRVSNKAADSKLDSNPLFDSFAKALPMCYPYTFHLMCREWNMFFKKKPISYCPLCPTMNGWRKTHNLVIPEDYLCYCSDDRGAVKNQKKKVLKVLPTTFNIFPNKKTNLYIRFCWHIYLNVIMLFLSIQKRMLNSII